MKVYYKKMTNTFKNSVAINTTNLTGKLEPSKINTLSYCKV